MERIAAGRLQKGGAKGFFGGITSMGWTDQYLRGFMGRKGLMSAIKGGKGNLEDYKKEELENRWFAGHTYENYNEYDEALIKKKDDLEKAKKLGDKIKEKNLTEEIEKMEGIFNNPKERKKIIAADAELSKTDLKNKYIKEANSNAEKMAKYSVFDYEGMKAERAAISEESSKITTSNEDELVAQFENAVAQGNSVRASALAQAITKVGGANALLNKFGYQAKGGLNAEEAKKLAKKPEEYDEKKGFNDFMRDIFQGRLKMDEQKTLMLQNDLAGIGQGIGHNYLTKTIKIDEFGRFSQSSEDDREATVFAEIQKAESEKFIRNNNRLFYGSEDRDDSNKFIWSRSGLAVASNNIEKIVKEIENNRFNKSAAKAMAQDDALDKLINKLKDIGKLDDSKGIKIKIDNKEYNTASFKEAFKNYSKGSSGDDAFNALKEV
jgi:hypothetical protein